jgi:hypothetical protein
MTESRDPVTPAPPHTAPPLTDSPGTAPARPAWPGTDSDAQIGAQYGGSPSAKDKAADTAQAGKEAAGEVVQAAGERAKDIAEETKKQARNVVGQAQDQLREQATTQQRSLVGNLRALGDELNSMAERSEQHGQATDLVSEAGTRAHSVVSWLDAREPGQLLDEVRSFARRKPGVFIAGALAAGLVAGRLTRGVVAVHQSDDESGAHAQPASSPGSASTSADLSASEFTGSGLPSDRPAHSVTTDPRIGVQP